MKTVQAHVTFHEYVNRFEDQLEDEWNAEAHHHFLTWNEYCWKRYTQWTDQYMEDYMSDFDHEDC